MREHVTVQVGQCGNQIGNCFWDLILREHAPLCTDGMFSPSMSSYFRNVDVRTGMEMTDGHLSSLRARAVVVDTEEGVLNQMLQSDLGELFEATEFIKGVSGAGNNFAHGHFAYGAEYGHRIMESTRRVVERCESLQSFMLLHSTGGGSGSGLGTFIMGELKDAYPKVVRFSGSILPSEDDDVVTSPYNAALALHELRENADCVFPMDNQALINICNSVEKPKQNKKTITSVTEPGPGNSKKDLAFSDMNNIVAHMISNLTSCARFHGKMNVDISELTTNLIPFPKMNFLISSLSPLQVSADSRKTTSSSSNIDRTFLGAFSRNHQLLRCDPINGRFLSCALLMRGDVNISDLSRNAEKLKNEIDLENFNPDGFKLGHCNVGPIGYPHALLTVSNNSAIVKVFSDMEQRFCSLYGPRRKAYVHHYTQYMEEDVFDRALETLRDIQHEYTSGLDAKAELVRNARREGPIM